MPSNISVEQVESPEQYNDYYKQDKFPILAEAQQYSTRPQDSGDSNAPPEETIAEDSAQLPHCNQEVCE